MKHSQIETLKVLVADFALVYPGRTVMMVSGLILAGFLDGLGIMAILPLIAKIGGGEQSHTVFDKITEKFLGMVGLQPTLLTLLTLICVAMLLKAVALLWANSQVGYTIANVTADLRNRFIQALMASRWQLFTGQSTGEIVNTLNTETQRSANAYEALTQSLSNAIQAIIFVILALTISFEVALAAVLAGAVLMYLLKYLINMTRTVGAEQTILVKTLTGRITDGLHGLKSLKAMGREKQLGTFLEDKVLGLKQVAKKTVFYKNALAISLEPLIVLFLALGLFMSTKVLQAPFSVQIVMALLFFRLISRIGNIQQSWQKVMLAESAYFSFRDRLASIEDMSERLGGGRVSARPIKVVLENVSFSYGDKNILTGLNAIIEPGQITTILGSSGAGKTTLADIIVGLHSPDKGRVLLGTTNLSKIDLNEWRAAIGYVPQEMFLFNRDLMANITLDDTTIEEAKVITALKQAGAWGFVKELPDGIHSNVGEQGTLLSGGQRQRIAIARALVRDPALLILDEATTALDPETEKSICKTVADLKQNRAILAITHQSAWVDISDRVYHLESGVIRVKVNSCE